MNTIQKYVGVAFLVLILFGLALCQITSKPASAGAQVLSKASTDTKKLRYVVMPDADGHFVDDFQYYGIKQSERLVILKMVAKHGMVQGIQFSSSQMNCLVSKACKIYRQTLESAEEVMTAEAAQMIQNGDSDAKVKKFCDDFAGKTMTFLTNVLDEYLKQEILKL